MLRANSATPDVLTSGRNLSAFRRISKTGLHLLLVSMLWMSAAASASLSEAGPAALPFRSVHGFAVVVPVFINGSGPYPFLLDTGSTCTTVDRELAETLHLPTEGEGTVTTVVRPEHVFLSSALTVSIGPVTERNVELLVRNLDGLRLVDRTLRGVLGQNALKGANYLIDYHRRVLQFDTGGALLSTLEGPRMFLRSIPSPDNPEYSVFAVSTRVVDVSESEKILILDSGTASLVLFSDTFAPALPVSQSSIQNVSGDRRSVELRSVRLHIGGATWNLTAHSLFFRGAIPEVNGLLPTSLFPSLYISNTRRFVIFAPTRKRRSPLDKDFATSDQNMSSHADESPGDQPIRQSSSRTSFLPKGIFTARLRAHR